MKYVDLFAGCGGLSLGLERAGLELIVAVEKSQMAAETFYHNFVDHVESKEEWDEYISSSIENQFEHKVIANEVQSLLNNKNLMNALKSETVDLVAGGPPCQGFSLAGKRNPDDARNKLPWQFLEVVEKISPKSVVIENVVGINRGFKKHGIDAPFVELQKALKSIGNGYVVQPVHVNAMHYGVPEHRPRLMIIALRKDIADAKNITSTNELWYSNFSDLVTNVPDLAPIPSIKEKELRTVKDAISDLSSLSKTSNNPNTISYLKEMTNPLLWNLKNKKNVVFLNHNQRNHQDTAKQRFRLYQYLMSQALAPNTLNIPAKNEYDVAYKLLTKLLANVELPAYSPDKTLLANDLDSLINLIFSLKTKKHSQRPLNWDKPSPTVVTLPDDYVHPSEARIFTVRELARFQSFPDAFEFKSKETTGSARRKVEVPQYSQVGNAVAPLLAFAVGKKIRSIIDT